MAFEPLRMSGGNEFTDTFGELNKNNTLAQARLAQAGIDSYWNRKAAKEVADARAYGGQGGGFGWSQALGLVNTGLGIAGGLGAFKGLSGSGSSIAPGSVAQANGVTQKAGFYGPAF